MAASTSEHAGGAVNPVDGGVARRADGVERAILVQDVAFGADKRGVPVFATRNRLAVYERYYSSHKGWLLQPLCPLQIEAEPLVSARIRGICGAVPRHRAPLLDQHAAERDATAGRRLVEYVHVFARALAYRSDGFGDCHGLRR